MVVDTSALIAVFFAERHARWVAARLTEHVGRPCPDRCLIPKTPAKR
jgi:uncharacterized protein with PIN domain